MGKILLLDADGVVIRPRHKYFSDKFSEEYNIPIDEILPFFKNEYKKCAIGEADIKDVLPKYLDKWRWEGSVDEFLNYWFEGEKDLDNQLIKLIDSIRKKGVKCYLASDNEKNRADYLMDEVGLKEHFDDGFYSSSLGVTKTDKEFFEKVSKELDIEYKDIIFWDDDPENTEVAQEVGIDAYTYKDFGEFVRKLDELFPEEMKDVMAFDTEDFYCDLVFSGKVDIKKVKETDNLLAFFHTRPSWSTHIVIVPKKHIAKLIDVEDMNLISEIFLVAKEIVLDMGLDDKNFRIVTNGGEFQDSKHLHFHLLSGKRIK